MTPGSGESGWFSTIFVLQRLEENQIGVFSLLNFANFFYQLFHYATNVSRNLEIVENQDTYRNQDDL